MLGKRSKTQYEGRNSRLIASAALPETALILIAGQVYFCAEGYKNRTEAKKALELRRRKLCSNGGHIDTPSDTGVSVPPTDLVPKALWVDSCVRQVEAITGENKGKLSSAHQTVQMRQRYGLA